HILVVVALVFASIPGFWLALMLLMFFSLHLKWLPSFGAGTLKHFILPTVTVSLTSAAGLLRLTCASMLETVRQEYIRTAKAKGAGEKVVIWRHALRNALIPVITTMGTSFGASLGGAIIAETVFAMPGMGTLLTGAIRQKDVPVVMGSTLFLALLFSIVVLVVDILYAFIDPRIRAKYENGGKSRE
ncbi:MAG: ABC transporter permease, partial [Oscillospiraceae bacterium]|nr:ABC transporter permease [Oscillospiraceae bacterium]